MASPSDSPALETRPAAPPDDGFLFRLYAAARSEELSRTGWSSEQRETFLREQHAARRDDYARRFAGAEHRIVLVDGEEAGAFILQKSLREIRLVDLAFLPDWRGRGLGTRLIRGWQQEAAGLRRPLTLAVRKENPARRLYKRVGFRAGAEHDGYVEMIWGR